MDQIAPAGGSGTIAAGPPYRFEDGVALIEVRLTSLHQLFNSIDPAPFHEKDLDPDAEDYIGGAARELPPQAPLKIVLHLPEAELTSELAPSITSAIQNYFAYRRSIARRDLRLLLRQGRISLAIGLAFLALCMTLRSMLPALDGSGWNQLFAEGLLISGWVAMWRPIQVFLYDWWPIWRSCRIYARLAAAGVELRPDAGSRAPGPAAH